MTEDQIERAARALCRLRGKDPDSGTDGWMSAADEIDAAIQVQQAIAEAMESKA
jgi:hypothetical protein